MKAKHIAQKGSENMIIVSGPSGCGKSTLIQMLLKKHRDLIFSISHTSRPRRKDERNGKNYYFISEKEFTQKIKENQFLEWARVYSHYYGTSFSEIQSKISHDKTVILDLDVQGARNLKKIYSNAWFVFVVPPSFAELKKRLVNRNRGESPAEIQGRFSKAKREMAEYKLYDFILINDTLAKAGSALDCIYRAFCQRRSRKESFILGMAGSEA